jgi:hypothetical protein
MSLLDPEFLLDDKFNVPKTLRLDHDEIRLELARASMQAGRVGHAAQRLEEVCLPHFEKEEKTVYPAFSLLHDVALSGVRSDMAAVLPLVFHCTAWHDAFLTLHETIISAAEELRLALHEEQGDAFVHLIENLLSHEKIEEEVMYPAVIWMGHFMRERLEDVQ